MYDTTNKKITAPISTTDIRTALGVSSNSLGYLIKNGSINIWSKCKPFRDIHIVFADDAARNTARYNANCGFTINTYTSPYNLLNAIKSSAVGSLLWTYNRPDGTTYHFRFGDFINYQGKDIYPPNEYTLTNTSKYYEDTIGVVNADHIHDESLRLKLSDMKATNDLLTASGKEEPYIGVIYCNSSSFNASNCKAVTLDNLADNDLLLPSSSLTPGVSYVGAFFYSSVSIALNGSASVSGSFVPIPYPRFNFSVNSGFGIGWRLKCSHLSYYDFTVTPEIYGGNSYGERTLDLLSFHQRQSSHYTDLGGGLYSITASADSSGYEQDAVIFGSEGAALGTNLKYVSAGGYASSSNASVREKLNIFFRFNVDVTTSGSLTFVKYRHLTMVGSHWHQVTVVTPVSYIMPAG